MSDTTDSTEEFELELARIIEEFENTRISFKEYRNKKGFNKSTLVEYQGRFADIKAELRPYKKEMVAQWTRRDDKAASAIKFRIAIAINDGEFLDDEGKVLYAECNSINQAEKFANGCDKYREFIDQRSFYKESMVNVNDLREDCTTFINLIKDILATL